MIWLHFSPLDVQTYKYTSTGKEQSRNVCGIVRLNADRSIYILSSLPIVNGDPLSTKAHDRGNETEISYQSSKAMEIAAELTQQDPQRRR